jgi:hypothetical protein
VLAFFFVAVDDEVEVPASFFFAAVEEVELADVPVFFSVVAVVDFLPVVVALVALLVVVADVSLLCAQDARRPIAAETAIKGNTSFFIGMLCSPESVHPAGESQAFSWNGAYFEWLSFRAKEECCFPRGRLAQGRLFSGARGKHGNFEPQ